MTRQISFSQAVEGFVMAAQARHLSHHTIEDYLNTYRKFDCFLEGDPPIAAIRSRQVEAFLAAQDVSKKTVLNYHTGLSALWTWALREELVEANIVQAVPRAKPEKKSINPYSQADVKAMLAVLKRSRAYTRPGKVESLHSLPNAERNRAVILLLLDTGIRASELCEARIHQVEQRNLRLTVFGKGSKERTIPFSARTGQALWKYLALRSDTHAGDFLFATVYGGPLDRNDMRKTLYRIGERAGVEGVNVHRFTHTFGRSYGRLVTAS